MRNKKRENHTFNYSIYKKADISLETIFPIFLISYSNRNISLIMQMIFISINNVLFITCFLHDLLLFFQHVYLIPIFPVFL